MWCRRCTSPVVGSSASGGLDSASCDRCMPRFDGDFLFCCTAMSIAPCSSMTVSPECPKLCKRSIRRVAPRRHTDGAANALLVPRRVRKAQNNLVFDQHRDIELAARLYPFGVLVVQIAGGNFARAHQ